MSSPRYTQMFGSNRLTEKELKCFLHVVGNKMIMDDFERLGTRYESNAARRGYMKLMKAREQFDQ